MFTETSGALHKCTYCMLALFSIIQALVITKRLGKSIVLCAILVTFSSFVQYVNGEVNVINML